MGSFTLASGPYNSTASYSIAYDSVTDEFYTIDGWNHAIDYNSATPPFAGGSVSSSSFGFSSTTALGLVYDPYHHLVYAVDTGGFTISTYAIYESNHSVAQIFNSPSGASMSQETYDSTNHHVYVCDYGFGPPYYDQISDINGVSHGTPVTLADSGICTIGFDPANGYVYVYTDGHGGSGSPSISAYDPVSGTVLATRIPVAGLSQEGFAYDPDNGNMYAAEGNAGSSVYEISHASQALVATITVGSSPYAVAYDAGAHSMAVTNRGSSSVSFIPSSSTSVSQTLSYGGGAAMPTVPCYDPVSEDLYVTDWAATTISIISPPSSGFPGASFIVDGDYVGMPTAACAFDSVDNTVLVVTDYNIRGATGYVLPTRHQLPTGVAPVGMVASTISGLLYIADYGASKVTVLRPDNSYWGNITVGSQPIAVSFDPVANLIAVASAGAGTVNVIDGASNSVVRTISVGGPPVKPTSLAYSPSNGYTYVALNRTGQVKALNLGLGTVVSTLAVGAYPVAMAYSPANQDIYVANYGSNNVSVINPWNTVVATLTTGPEPNSVAASPLAVGEIAVTNLGSNSVSLYAGTTLVATTAVGTSPDAVSFNQAVCTGVFAVAVRGVGYVVFVLPNGGLCATLPVGNFPSSVTINPTSGNTMVTNWGSNSITVIGADLTVYNALPVGKNPMCAFFDTFNSQAYVADYGGSTVEDP